MLLKMSWEQKEGGTVQDPTLFLFLPPDLGACTTFSPDEINSYKEGSAMMHGVGIPVTYSLEKFILPDFICNNTNKPLTCNDYHNVVGGDHSFFMSDPYMALSFGLTLPKSLSVPGTENVCELSLIHI